jgi:hypothetical protein
LSKLATETETFSFNSSRVIDPPLPPLIVSSITHVSLPPIESSLATPVASIGMEYTIGPTSVLPIDDISICKYCIKNPFYNIPPPATSVMDLNLGDGRVFQCYRDDFHTSFSGFLSDLPADLQLSTSALETNRYAILMHISVVNHCF